MSASMTAPPPDPGSMGGAPPMDPNAAPDDNDAGGDNVLVTIVKNDDGSYLVYSGDEPDNDSGDMSDDDADAMGAAGAAPAPSGGDMGSPQGQPADSVGAALKIALDILNADKSGGDSSGNADSQFAAGFSGSQAPTPVGMGGAAAQKF